MKEKIKQSAIKLFHRKGYFATGMRTLANAAGMQMASIYHHYPSKEDILMDILRTTMTDLQDMLRNRLDAASSTMEKFQAAIKGHIIFHIERKEEVIISDSELRGLTAENYREITQMRDEYEKEIQRLLKECVVEGIFAEMDINVISYAVLTMCSAVPLWFKKSGRLTKEEVADIYTAMILKGLAKS
jgi:AcrR family transcriptional regulator